MLLVMVHWAAWLFLCLPASLRQGCLAIALVSPFGVPGLVGQDREQIMSCCSGKLWQSQHNVL